MVTRLQSSPQPPPSVTGSSDSFAVVLSTHPTGEAVLLGKDKQDRYQALLQELGSDEQVLTFYFFKQEEKIAAGDKITPHNIVLWNGGSIKRMKAHPASAGHGLNLQKSNASHIVFYSTPWSSEQYIQAIGRVARSGNKAQTVFVHHMVAENTLETRVIKNLKKHLDLELELVG